MLPCTKSYISISILKKMLTCQICDKRVHNPHSYDNCDQHFFCLLCKGDGSKCPVCEKPLANSDISKDSFLDDILKTSCFTVHDRDFDREKVPLHVVKELCKEFEKIDKIYLNGKAANNYCTPVKSSSENEVAKIHSKDLVQMKLEFDKEKQENSLPSRKKVNESIVKLSSRSNANRQSIERNSINKNRLSRGSSSKLDEKIDETSNLLSVRRKSSESGVSLNNAKISADADKQNKQLISKDSSQEKATESSLDSQSIFLSRKLPKKPFNKLMIEKEIEDSKKPVTSTKSETTSDKKSRRSVESGPEKKKSRQSLSYSSPKDGKTESEPKKGGRENLERSILDKDKKVKNIFKKNAKGETALHIACRTNKIDQLKDLLASDWKFHINEKDFAGWTPLHEAVTSGNYEVAKILLEAGAWVFVPGYNFETPLHTALYRTKELVELIMRYGPDIEARTINGQTPSSIAKDLGLEDLLKDYSSASKSELPTPPASCPTVIYCHVPDLLNKNLILSIKTFNVTVASNFSKEVSHVILNTNECNVCESSMMVLEAMLMGKFLVNAKWLEDSVAIGRSVECEPFEVSGVGDSPVCDAPYKARLNAYRLFPGLFAGAFFYLVGNWRDSSKREKVIALINLGEGTLLKREPDPENIPSNEATVMYHTKPASSMGKCSHILLYNEESDGPQIKYRMNHIKTLPLRWLMKCIESFSIIDPE